MKTTKWLVCLAASMAVLASCGSSSSPPKAAAGSSTSTARHTTATTVALARGSEEPRRDIPWDEVGPGWALAEWTSSPPTEPGPTATTVPGQSNSLFLVNPEGGRYLVTTIPSASPLSLTGWSGDGQRALLVGPMGGADNGGTVVTELNLENGSRDTFTLPGIATVEYSNPKGLALLATIQGSASQGTPTQLERLSLTGSLEFTYPDSFKGAGAFGGFSSPSPDGTEIAMSAQSGGVAIVSNEGSVLATVVVPGMSYCSPTRWWTATQILTSCAPDGSGIPLLWLLPAAGGSATPFTVAPPAGNSDAGDEVAWQVGNQVYLQDAGGCGYQYLAKLNAYHTTTPVTVPGVVNGDSQFVKGTVGNLIALQTSISCGEGVSLLWFDPQTSQTTVVLGPGMNGGSVTTAVLFGDNNGSLF
jgi:hypothetical protein